MGEMLPRLHRIQTDKTGPHVGVGPRGQWAFPDTMAGRPPRHTALLPSWEEPVLLPTEGNMAAGLAGANDTHASAERALLSNRMATPPKAVSRGLCMSWICSGSKA